MKKTNYRWRMAGMLAALVIGGCGANFPLPWYGDDYCAPPPPTPASEVDGELNLGTFEWDCLDEGDAICGTGLFPSKVALGGRFDVDFFPSSRLPDEIGVSEIESASPTRLSVGDGFTAIQEGPVAMVAMSGEGAIDFVEVEVTPVTRFRLTMKRQEPPPEDGCPEYHEPENVFGGEVEVVVGDKADIYAAPYAGGDPLGGSLDYEWESQTPGIATISPIRGRKARLTALAVGTVEILVRAGGHEELLVVEVDPAPIEEDDEGPTRTLPEDGDETDGETEGGETEGGETDGDTDGDTDGGETDGDTDGMGGSDSSGGTN